MNRRDSLSRKRFHNDLQPTNALLHHQVLSFQHLVAHDTHHFGTECFHSWDRPLYFVQSDGKIIPHIFPPIGNSGSEGVYIPTSSRARRNSSNSASDTSCKFFLFKQRASIAFHPSVLVVDISMFPSCDASSAIPVRYINKIGKGYESVINSPPDLADS